jgi:hypothetical protein
MVVTENEDEREEKNIAVCTLNGVVYFLLMD